MEPLPIDEGWLDRVEQTIARLRAKVAAHPGEVYWRLCLQGWEQERERILSCQGCRGFEGGDGSSGTTQESERGCRQDRS
jgi:hypothetical protein